MKRKKIKLAIIIVLTTISVSVFAQRENTTVPQSAPIPIELFLGGDAWTYQVVVDKKFPGSNRFGFFGLSYLRANYDNDDYLRESVNLALLKYNVYKGLSVLSGALYNSNWGFRPYAGAQYAYHSRTFMGLLTSGFHLTETKNFETIAMIEYRPVIKRDWSWYTRVQGMYSLNTLIGKHDRSYLYSRVGVTYKTYSVGAALNYDWYGFGPMKIEDHQWGIFISTIL